MDPEKQAAGQRSGGEAEVGVVVEAGGGHRPGKAEPGTGGGVGWEGSQGFSSNKCMLQSWFGKRSFLEMQ